MEQSNEVKKVTPPEKSTEQIPRVKRAQWLAEGKSLFGTETKDWQFVCPSCGNIQSMRDFAEAGVDDPASKVHYSCIGRWTGDQNDMCSGKQPCNYTLGGLLVLAELYVIDADGQEHPVFRFAEIEKE